MSTVKKTARTTKKNTSKQSASAWWASDKDMGGDIPKSVQMLGSRTVELPNGAGILNLFDGCVGIKLSGVRLMSAVDDNNKCCLALEDKHFDFFEKMQALLLKSKIAEIKHMMPKYADAEFQGNAKVSEQTGQKYLKTKVQLLGPSQTMGLDEKGSNVANVPAALSIPDTLVDIRVRIDGAYLTTERCGMVTKVDIFRIKSKPSAEEQEESRAAKRARFEDARKEELQNF